MVRLKPDTTIADLCADFIELRARDTDSGETDDTVCRSARSGHHQHAIHGVRCRWQRNRAAPARARADHVAARVGRARPTRDRGAHEHCDRRRAAPREPLGARPGGHRRHQSARDDGRVESEDRPALVQRHRVAGHAHRSHRQRPRPHARRQGHPRPYGVAARDVLFRREVPVDPRARRRRSRRRGARRGGLRDDRQLGDLEPDGRRGRRRAHHRRDERQPHDADGSAHAHLGRRAARDSSAFRARSLPEIRPSSDRNALTG